MGVNGNLLGLLRNYLSGRTQIVVVDGVKSDPQPVRAGVPQGSILGPLLFLVYVNDLPDCVSSNISLFADDTTLWTPVDDPVMAADLLNRDLARVHQWANKWRMKLNADKTEVLTISCKRLPMRHPDLSIDGTILRRVTSHKHLGLTISSNMSWSEHIDNICASAGSRLNILRKLGHKLSRRTIELLYFAYVRPLLEYGSVIFGDHHISDALKLDRVQNQAALICTGALYNTNRARLLDELGWPSLNNRRDEMRACIVYKALNGFCPEYLSNLLREYVPNDNQRHSSRHIRNLLVPICKTERFKRSFIPTSIRLWNTYSASFAGTNRFGKFRALLKKKYRPKHPPVWYYTGKKRPNLLLTRLRLNNSHLTGDVYRNNLTGDPSCSCGYRNEDRVHYLLDCPIFSALRNDLFQNVGAIISPFVDVNLFLNLDRQYIINLLLSGCTDYDVQTNINISNAVQLFIIRSGRFVRQQ